MDAAGPGWLASRTCPPVRYPAPAEVGGRSAPQAAARDPHSSRCHPRLPGPISGRVAGSPDPAGGGDRGDAAPDPRRDRGPAGGHQPGHRRAGPGAGPHQGLRTRPRRAVPLPASSGPGKPGWSPPPGCSPSSACPSPSRQPGQRARRPQPQARRHHPGKAEVRAKEQGSCPHERHALRQRRRRYRPASRLPGPQPARASPPGLTARRQPSVDAPDQRIPAAPGTPAPAASRRRTDRPGSSSTCPSRCLPAPRWPFPDNAPRPGRYPWLRETPTSSAAAAARTASGSGSNARNCAAVTAPGVPGPRPLVLPARTPAARRRRPPRPAAPRRVRHPDRRRAGTAPGPRAAGHRRPRRHRDRHPDRRRHHQVRPGDPAAARSRPGPQGGRRRPRPRRPPAHGRRMAGGMAGRQEEPAARHGPRLRQPHPAVLPAAHRLHQHRPAPGHRRRLGVRGHRGTQRGHHRGPRPAATPPGGPRSRAAASSAPPPGSGSAPRCARRSAPT